MELPLLRGPPPPTKGGRQPQVARSFTWSRGGSIRHFIGRHVRLRKAFSFLHKRKSCTDGGTHKILSPPDRTKEAPVLKQLKKIKKNCAKASLNSLAYRTIRRAVCTLEVDADTQVAEFVCSRAALLSLPPSSIQAYRNCKEGEGQGALTGRVTGAETGGARRTSRVCAAGIID
jgi:hypothetical protein